ncbi:MAG: LysM peptidoglycan-binding domain-containing protein [Akkermansiaceae bacterium]
MQRTTLSLLSLAVISLTSCGGNSGDNYDTAVTPGYQTTTPDNATATYGAAAYEDTTGAVAAPVVDGATAPTTDAVVSTAVAKEHYVAPGDSLWKISKQYGVSIDAIKAANNMTNDTVILGKKMIIPAP